MAGKYPFPPFGEVGKWSYETRTYNNGNYTWIPTRQRWELSGGSTYNTQVTKSPNQVVQDAIRLGKTREQAEKERTKQVNRLTNPTLNYLFNASVVTGAGNVIRDAQSELSALEQIRNITDLGTEENTRVRERIKVIKPPLEKSVGELRSEAIREEIESDNNPVTIFTPTPTPPPPPPSVSSPEPVTPPPPALPPVVIPPKPPRARPAQATPYKSLALFGNQYPAEDTSVKLAADTVVSDYYSGFTVTGHFENSETAERAQVGGARVSTALDNTINFIVSIDGSRYCSPALNQKILAAASEGNPYYLLSIPIINVNTRAIPPYGRDIFAREEAYAGNKPTNQIDGVEELLAHISWTCRQTVGIDSPRDFSDRYKKASELSNVGVEFAISTSNKPPKVRFKRGGDSSVNPPQSTPPPKVVIPKTPPFRIPRRSKFGLLRRR